jgi:hypothetical protein
MATPCTAVILLVAFATVLAATPAEYNPSGFSNFWEEAEPSPSLGKLRAAELPVEVQGIVHSYLRQNPAGFSALIPHVRSAQTWVTAGAFADSILEEADRRQYDRKEVEHLLMQNIAPPLAGAVIGPILRTSPDQHSSIESVVLSSQDIVASLNALILLVEWSEVRAGIESAVQKCPAEKREELTRQVQAWYHQ